MLPFLYSPIFREYKKGKLARNGLSKMSLLYHPLIFIDFHIFFTKHFQKTESVIRTKEASKIFRGAI